MYVCMFVSSRGFSWYSSLMSFSAVCFAWITKGVYFFITNK